MSAAALAELEIPFSVWDYHKGRRRLHDARAMYENECQRRAGIFLENSMKIFCIERHYQAPHDPQKGRDERMWRARADVIARDEAEVLEALKSGLQLHWRPIHDYAVDPVETGFEDYALLGVVENLAAPQGHIIRNPRRPYGQPQKGFAVHAPHTRRTFTGFAV